MPARLSDGVRVPGDKSITHRALILAALSSGSSTVRRPLTGADIQSTAAVLRALGVEISAHPDAFLIEGVGLHGLKPPDARLDCGNSGTTARLMMGALAGHPFAVELTGDASLCRRPMRRVTEPLSLMGAAFDELGESDRLPVRITGGALRPLQYDSPHASAQVKSAILLAGLTGSADVHVKEPVLSRDHTERMLEHLGVPLVRQMRDEYAAVSLRPVSALPAFELEVPADISSAAFIAAFATLLPRGRTVRMLDVGLNPTRTGFLDVIERMGARVQRENLRESCGEPLGDLIVHGSVLRGTIIAPHEVPSLIDELPIIAVLAARAEGETRVQGAAELRVKESDRIRAIVSNIASIGGYAEELEDGFIVKGTEATLHGSIDTAGDHRIAMAFGVLSAARCPDVKIDDRDVAGVSFPGFWELLEQLRQEVAG